MNGVTFVLYSVTACQGVPVFFLFVGGTDLGVVMIYVSWMIGKVMLSFFFFFFFPVYCFSYGV